MASTSSASTARTPMMTPVKVALDRVLRECSATLGPEEVLLKQAVGRYLYEDVFSVKAMPSCRTSVMDGYAVVAGQLPGELEVTERIFAGHKWSKKLVAGTCAYVATGGPIPLGAGAVVKVEDSQASSSSSKRGVAKGKEFVLLKHKPQEAQEGSFVRAIGSDIKLGQKLLKKGEKILPVYIGILASNGMTTVKVHKRPRVAVLSTGDELVQIEKHEEEEKATGVVSSSSSSSSSSSRYLDRNGLLLTTTGNKNKQVVASAAAGAAAGAGGGGNPTGIDDEKIFDSNGPMLRALVRSCGGIAVNMGISRDSSSSSSSSSSSLKQHKDANDSAAAADGSDNIVSMIVKAALDDDVDIFISSGGVSMGRADPVKVALNKMVVTTQKGQQYQGAIGRDGVFSRAKIHFDRMRMKPGKPTTFATILFEERKKKKKKVNEEKEEEEADEEEEEEIKRKENKKKLLYFGLPGNPVSCAVTFELLVSRAIWKLSGDSSFSKYQHINNKDPSYKKGGGESSLTPAFSAFLAHPIRMDAIRPEYHRVHVVWRPTRKEGEEEEQKGEKEGLIPNQEGGGGGGGDYYAYSTGRQASSRILSMYGANALAFIPQGKGELPCGSSVCIYPLSSSSLAATMIRGGGERRRAAIVASKKNHNDDDEKNDGGVVGEQGGPCLGVAVINMAAQQEDSYSSLDQLTRRLIMMKKKGGKCCYRIKAFIETNDEDNDTTEKQNVLGNTTTTSSSSSSSSNIIKSQALLFSKRSGVDLVIFLGKTGYATSDIAPEIAESLIIKNAPSLAIAITMLVTQRGGSNISLGTSTYRAVAGSDGNSLILTLPGDISTALHVLQKAYPVICQICREMKR